MTWILIVMYINSFGEVAAVWTTEMPDHETCMIAGDAFIRSTLNIPDTYHCVNLDALHNEAVM